MDERATNGAPVGRRISTITRAECDAHVRFIAAEIRLIHIHVSLHAVRRRQYPCVADEYTATGAVIDLHEEGHRGRIYRMTVDDALGATMMWSGTAVVSRKYRK